MAIVYANLTSATLTGAMDFNRIHRTVAQEDLGFMIEQLVSSLNQVQCSVSTLNIVVSTIMAAAISAAGSGVTWSAFSTVPSETVLLTVGTVSNFRASNPA
jgi:hypothetical protein